MNRGLRLRRRSTASGLAAGSFGNERTANVPRDTRWIPRALAVLLGAHCLLGPVAEAADVDRVWRRLYADHLPEYCKYTQSLPDHSRGDYGHPLSTGKYRTLFGEAWHHLHHYCFGLDLMYQNAKLTPSVELRRGNLAQAVREFDYVIDRSDDSMVLAAEIHFKKGVALMGLEQYVDAVESLTRAISIRDDYVPAYLALSNYFERFGDLEQATLIAQRGLERAPDTPVLRKRVAELTRSEAPGSRSSDSTVAPSPSR